MGRCVLIKVKSKKTKVKKFSTLSSHPRQRNFSHQVSFCLLPMTISHTVGSTWPILCTHTHSIFCLSAFNNLSHITRMYLHPHFGITESQSLLQSSSKVSFGNISIRVLSMQSSLIHYHKIEKAYI